MTKNGLSVLVCPKYCFSMCVLQFIIVITLNIYYVNCSYRYETTIKLEDGNHRDSNNHDKMERRYHHPMYNLPTSDIFQGYLYPQPNPPFSDQPLVPLVPDGLYDVPSKPNISFHPLQDQPFSGYLPPSFHPTLEMDLQPPLFDDSFGIPPQAVSTSTVKPSEGYLPPQLPSDDFPLDNATAQFPSSDQYLPPHTPEDTPLVPIDRPGNYLPPSSMYETITGRKTVNNFIKVQNMSCLDTTKKKFFQATIKMNQLVKVEPVVDGGTLDGCLSGHIDTDTFTIELVGHKAMARCGVRYCSGTEQLNMCLSVRLPTIRGLKLPEDRIMSLHCKPQQKIASQTKYFKVKPRPPSGRSASIITTGGLQRNFETQMLLFRKNFATNEFSQVVNSGSSVILGEELMLRASIKEGDGWTFSRLGQISMHSVSSLDSRSQPRFTQKDSVTLVDEAGCRVESMRAVCPEQPKSIGPLIHTFTFRAFMFQGARSGDEMILSVKMIGCLQHEDCLQDKHCQKGNFESKSSRQKRNADSAQKDSDISNWQSYLEFRVVLPNSNESGVAIEEISVSENSVVITAFAIGFTLVIVVLFCLVVCCWERKITRITGHEMKTEGSFPLNKY